MTASAPYGSDGLAQVIGVIGRIGIDDTRRVVAIPAVDRGARDAELVQCALGGQMRLLVQLDDLGLLGGGISHAPSSPIPAHAFFKQAVLQGEIGYDLL